jgi:hypothetical protein
MEPAIGSSASLGNLTPAELAQQARQRDGVSQSNRGEQAQRTQPVQPGQVQQARPVPADAASIPALRPADLTQQAQFDLTSQQAQDAGQTGAQGTEPLDVAQDVARPGVQDRIGPAPASGDLSTAFQTETLLRDPDPLRQGDTLAQADVSAEDDLGRPSNIDGGFQSADDGNALNPEQQAQFRQISETVSFLQDASGSGAANERANDNGPESAPVSGSVEAESTAERAAERTGEEDVSGVGSGNDAAGPTLPRGSNLSLVA